MSMIQGLAVESELELVRAGPVAEPEPAAQPAPEGAGLVVAAAAEETPR